MANKGCTPAVMNIRVIDRNPVSHNVSAKTIVAVYMIRSEVGAERNQHRSPDQPEMDPIFRLLHNGQREVISVAALVVNLQSVVASGNCRAIRKVTKDACNGGRGGIVNYGKSGAQGKRTVSEGIERKVCIAVDRDAVGDCFIRRASGGFQVHIIS